jgi:hypothetical protein
VAPTAPVRWVEGKGRVEYEDGRPVRMAGVCMMVTRRKEAELARLSTAEEASRLKDEFLATARLMSSARRSTRSWAGCRCCRMAGSRRTRRVTPSMSSAAMRGCRRS